MPIFFNRTISENEVKSNYKDQLFCATFCQKLRKYGQNSDNSESSLGRRLDAPFLKNNLGIIIANNHHDI
jgi:hypothetical protein